MKSTTHELKTDSEVFGLVLIGLKTFEIRKNDREFKCDDYLMLRETKYTGQQMRDGAPLKGAGRAALKKFLDDP